MPLVVRVAGVELVERVEDNGPVSALLELVLDRRALLTVAVQRETVGYADVVELVAPVESGLPQQTLHRARALLGIDDQGAPTAGRANPEALPARRDGAQHLEHERRLALAGASTDGGAVAATERIAQQLVLGRRIRQLADVSRGHHLESEWCLPERDVVLDRLEHGFGQQRPRRRIAQHLQHVLGRRLLLVLGKPWPGPAELSHAATSRDAILLRSGQRNQQRRQARTIRPLRSTTSR